MSAVDLHAEAPEGGLKELVLKWFTETQAPLILNNGNFPDWFQGFAARKDTEDLLRDKALGCFLIRLSDKAIGYILSYRGHDRCRHFVITQNPDGRFSIAGDLQTYGSLSELIQHYRVSPIQPFGEHLTSSCYEVDAGELYDVVSAKERSGVSVKALRTLWDHDHHHRSNSGSKSDPPPGSQPPTLPPKSKSRKLTGAVSVGTVSLSQGVPPVPKRGTLLGLSLSGSLPDTSSHPGETQTDPHRSQRLRGSPNPAPVSDRDSFNGADTSSAAGATYSELVESRSRSLPRLNNTEEEEEQYSNQLSLSFTASPTPLKRVTCHTYSLHDPRDGPRPGSSRSEQQGEEVEMSRSNPLYHTSEGPGGGQQADGMYAEVPQRPTPAGLTDNTYELIPGEAAAAAIAAAAQGNMYESLEDVKTKKPKSTWGKNNMNWKKFLPDYKKK